MDRRLNDNCCGEDSVVVEESDETEPFLSFKVPRLLVEGWLFRLFILNTLRSLFVNDNLVFIDMSDWIDMADVVEAIEGLLSLFKGIALRRLPSIDDACDEEDGGGFLVRG